MQEQLGARQEEYDTLLKECKSLREQVTVAEAGSRTVMEQYQTTVEEMEVLRTHCKMVEGQLGETKVRRERNSERRGIPAGTKVLYFCGFAPEHKFNTR